MKLLSTFGEVYRLSDKNYKKFLQHVADNKGDWNLEDFGGKAIGSVVDVTDMTKFDAREKLGRNADNQETK